MLAWFVYDGLCRAFERDEALLAILVFAFICVSAWAVVEPVRTAGRVSCRWAR